MGGPLTGGQLGELGAGLQPERWPGTGEGAGVELPDEGVIALADRIGIHSGGSLCCAYFCLLLGGKPQLGPAAGDATAGALAGGSAGPTAAGGVDTEVLRPPATNWQISARNVLGA